VEWEHTLKVFHYNTVIILNAQNGILAAAIGFSDAIIGKIWKNPFSSLAYFCMPPGLR